MKIHFIVRLLIVVTIVASSVLSRVIVNSGKRRKHLSYDGGDYEASGDYFEVVSTTVPLKGQVTSTAKLRTLTSATMSTSSSLVDGSGEGSGDGGVELETSTLSSSYASLSSSTEGSGIDDESTCTPTSIRRFDDDEYQLSNHVLAIFKVNVSSNGRELYFFLHLAKRFNLSEMYRDVKFVVVCAGESSDDVIEYIVSENFPLESIVVVDDNDEAAEKLGLPLEMEDLHVYIVDQCSNLAYIISPPWSSARYPYLKAGLLSCYFDLPCGCTADEFISSISSKEAETRRTRTDAAPKLSIKDETSDEEEEDIENIEELLHNSNSLTGNHSALAIEGLIPLRIVIPSLHVHYRNQTASYWLYEDIVIKSSSRKSPYDHFHLKSGVRLLEVRRPAEAANYAAQNNNSKSISSVNLSKSSSEMFVGNRTIKDIWTIAQSDQIFIDRNGRAYKIQKTISDGFDVVRVDFDVVRLKPFRRNYGTQQQHYEQLKKWTDAVI